MTRTDWGLMERVIPHARRTLLYGPPGTGKSTVATREIEGQPVFTVSLHEETTVAELVGHFMPVGDRFVWFDGPALAAWRVGGKLVLDEIDLASGAVLSVCRMLLNDERVARITIPNQSLASMTDEEIVEAMRAGQGLETLYPGDRFQVVATMNGEPEDLDGPLAERFDATFYVGEPHPNAIAALPAALRTTAKRTAVETDEARRISVRRWHNFVNLARATGHEDAAFAVFGARAGDIVDGLKLGGVDLAAVFGEGGDESGETIAAPAATAPRKRTARTADAPPATDDAEVLRLEAELGRKTRAELRDLAARWGLKQGPTKAHLIRRLAEHSKAAADDLPF